MANGESANTEPPDTSTGATESAHGEFLATGEALHQSAAQFQLLVQSIQDYAIFMLDPEGHVVSWNVGAQRIKQYTAAEIIGQPFSVFYTPADRAPACHEWGLQCAATAGRYAAEGWRVRKDGSLFWANVVITALHDAQGHLLGFGNVTRDLTARKQAEEALRASEERLHTLVTNVPVILFVLDAHGVFTLSEGLGLALLGRAPGTTVGLSALDLYVDNAMILDALQRALRGETVTYTAHVAGVALDTRLVPLCDAAGQQNGVIGVATDVTARLKAETAVRETEARFQDVVQAAPIGICIMDEHGVFEDVNASYAGMLGYAPEELVGRPFAIVFTDDQRAAAESTFQRLLATGGQSMSERVLRRKDGSLCTALGTSIPLSGADGRPRRVGFVVDINERKRAEVLLEASEARFRALTQHTSDLVCVLGPAGDVLYESPSYARFLGASLATITARHGTRLAIVHPDDHAMVSALFQRIRANAPAERLEWRLLAADGSWRTFDGIATNHTDDPSVGGIVVTNRDISARKAAEAALRESAAQFRTLVELAPIGACIMDE